MSMYWQDREENIRSDISDDVVDVVFVMECKTLPVDHAHALYLAIEQVLPWIKEQASAGIHPIHVADSGNGWLRPDNPDDVLYLSKRTKLELRIPREKLDSAHELTGKTLEVAGSEMLIKKATIRKLSPLTTLFARYVVGLKEESEDAFMERIVEDIKQRGINPRKVLAGKTNNIRTLETPLVTRSLLISDLSVSESILLQKEGLGQHQHLGCGLFIPHKEVVDLRGMLEEGA